MRFSRITGGFNKYKIQGCFCIKHKLTRLFCKYIILQGLATKTLNEINGLYKKRPELKRPLDECSRRYKTILNADVPEAIEAISKGVPKFGEDGVIDAGVEASVCERGFKGKSPLTSLTKSMQKISNVTRAIVRLLL